MALKPSYDDKLHLSGLSNTEILILALEASQKLEWNIEEIAPEWIRFEVPINMHTSGEEITFTLGKEGDGEISIHSECTSIQEQEEYTEVKRDDGRSKGYPAPGRTYPKSK